MSSINDWLDEIESDAAAKIQADAAREMNEAGRRAVLGERNAAIKRNHVARLNGFHVVPRQLVILAEHLNESATSVNKSTAQLGGTKIGADQLGLLGRETDAPRNFNLAVDDLLETMSTAGKSIAKAAEDIRRIAAHYVRQDDEFYHGFEKLDPTGSVPRVEH